MDLKPYIARGFPGPFDQGIASLKIKGIDRDQAVSMVRVCAETEATLYGREFSPRAIRYRKGSRPKLEKITTGLAGATPRASTVAAMAWTAKNVIHPHLVGETPVNRALGEEGIIDSRVGWCTEQSRVFIALCEVMEIPARICYLFHSNLICGHQATEVLLDGRWVFFDPTFDITATLPDGRAAEGRDLSGPYRQLAHEVYKPALKVYFAGVKPFVESHPGWRRADRPKLEAGGDLMAYLGITNYVIEGAEGLSAV